MKLSKVYEHQYFAACRQGKSDKERDYRFVKWQKQLKREGKFYTLGKPVVGAEALSGNDTCASQ